MTKPATSYYFECHITLDPVMDTHKVDQLKQTIAPRDFRLAKLFMQKGVPSNLDSFITGRHKDYETLLQRMYTLVEELPKQGFHIRRYKIENVLLDVRITRDNMTASPPQDNISTNEEFEPTAPSTLRKLWVNVTDKAATFDLTDSPVVESEEIAPGVIVHYGTDGEPAQIEIILIEDLELRMS